ncbi:hypothetical protein Slala03_20700 [Streptomyces lavendulae subsp. lavendulae]|nr:hypothetical protein Slala03_20700 [Streptomyces lavendulae subsp. lavendulae]
MLVPTSHIGETAKRICARSPAENASLTGPSGPSRRIKTTLPPRRFTHVRIRGGERTG